MVQKYPSGGNQMQPVRPAPPPPPASVVNAVKLMYAGAAVSLVSLIVALGTLGDTKTAIRKAYPHYTAAQVNNLNNFSIGVGIVFGLFGVGLWLWMARANNRGRNWARVVSTILFVVSTFDVFHLFSVPHTALDLVFPLLVWLVGAGTIFLLWRPDSTAFYKAAQGSLLSRRPHSPRSRVGPVSA